MGLLLINNLSTRDLESNFKQNAKMYYFNGATLIVLGLIALLAPVVAATIIDLMIGILLLVTGLSQFAFSFATSRNWTYYLTALVATVAGILMLVQPSTGIMALGAIIMAYLFAQGILQITFAFVNYGFRGWGWMLFSGFISLMLAGIIYAGWPITATWILGVMVGVDFITLGLCIIMVTRYINSSNSM